MALSHVNLLQEWRDRAGKGQSDARRVIAEMLTPSGIESLQTRIDIIILL
jgi:hypothetical protein